MKIGRTFCTNWQESWARTWQHWCLWLKCPSPTWENVRGHVMSIDRKTWSLQSNQYLMEKKSICLAGFLKSAVATATPHSVFRIAIRRRGRIYVDIYWDVKRHLNTLFTWGYTDKREQGALVVIREYIAKNYISSGQPESAVKSWLKHLCSSDGSKFQNPNSWW